MEGGERDQTLAFWYPNWMFMNDTTEFVLQNHIFFSGFCVSYVQLKGFKSIPRYMNQESIQLDNRYLILYPISKIYPFG